MVVKRPRFICFAMTQFTVHTKSEDNAVILARSASENLYTRITNIYIYSHMYRYIMYRQPQESHRCCWAICFGQVCHIVNMSQHE